LKIQIPSVMVILHTKLWK